MFQLRTNWATHITNSAWPKAAFAMFGICMAAGCHPLGFRFRDSSQSITVRELDPEIQRELDAEIEQVESSAKAIASRKRNARGNASQVAQPSNTKRLGQSVAKAETKKTLSDRGDEEDTDEVSIVETETPDPELDATLASIPPQLRKQIEYFHRQNLSTDDTAESRGLRENPTASDSVKLGPPVAISPPSDKKAADPNSIASTSATSAVKVSLSDSADGASSSDHASKIASAAVHHRPASEIADPQVVTASTDSAGPLTPKMLTSGAAVGTAAHGSQDSWNRSLAQAIDQLKKKIEQSPSADENLSIHEQATLRMLYLANGKTDDSLQPIDGLQDHEKEYFRYQLQALHEATNPDAIPVRSRRWSLVMNHQNQASSHLAAVSNLEVKKVAFCNNVEGYGVYSPFQTMQFKPDQDVLLYCELENVTAEAIKEGFETQLQGWYEIIDSSGSRVTDQLLPMEKEICRNHRRDYFIIYHIYLPAQVSPGNYKMQLTIEDMKAKKFGQAHIDFQMVK